MMKSLLLLLAVCAVAACMVPRERRALNEEEVPRTAPSSTTTTAKPKEVCAEHTPCAWIFYNPVTRAIQNNATNTYCDCSEGKICSVTKDDSNISGYILHCRPPSEVEYTLDS